MPLLAGWIIRRAEIRFPTRSENLSLRHSDSHASDRFRRCCASSEERREGDHCYAFHRAGSARFHPFRASCSAVFVSICTMRLDRLRVSSSNERVVPGRGAVVHWASVPAGVLAATRTRRGFCAQPAFTPALPPIAVTKDQRTAHGPKSVTAMMHGAARRLPY